MNNESIQIGGAAFTPPAVGEQILVGGYFGQLASYGIGPTPTLVVRMPDARVALGLQSLLERDCGAAQPAFGAFLEVPVEICDWPSRRVAGSTVGTWLLPRGMSVAETSLVLH